MKDTPVLSSLGLAPSGHLHFRRQDPFGHPLAEKDATAIEAAFSRGTGHGLLHLGAVNPAGDLGPTLGFWREVAKLFLSQLSSRLDLDEALRSGLEVALEDGEADRLLAAAPPMLGIEYLRRETLAQIWKELEEAFVLEVRASGKPAASFLEERIPLWREVGRVFFHLAENKARPDRPFAFLASYTARLSSAGKLQHVPLGNAVQREAARGSRAGLLSLLVPVQQAAAESPFLKELVDSGRIFQPLTWTPREAHGFLRDVPIYERHGVFVRIPDWWKPRQPPRVKVGVSVGGAPPAGLGAEALLDFSVELTLDGETISDAERREILAAQGGLALVKGRWVEVDGGKLKDLLERWKTVERQVRRDGLTFLEAMRLLAGAPAERDAGAPAAAAAETAGEWLEVAAGEWLSGVLESLRAPVRDRLPLDGALHARLRPYQEEGVQWLWLLHRLRLGGCLADDMGLGKTIQVLALLLLMKREAASGGKRPSLLVLPASLIGNWKAECARFAPGLRLLIAHPSELERSLESPPPGFAKLDLVITTYGMLSRQAWLAGVEWSLVVLDEAQAIKNPSARQTRAVKSLKSLHRLALTGTPVENRLGDLWSLFDFLHPGLLGSARSFSRLVAPTARGSGGSYGAVRALVRPYLLRRLKTDKRIVADLPEKQELKVFCALRKAQAVLYQQAVDQLAASLKTSDGMKRRGTILAFLMRFKQICNHPSQWTGDGGYAPEESGKMARLAEICEEVAGRQEKVLVFTQFKEITGVLSGLLARVFGREGLVLTGDTPVKRRRQIVEAFQSEAGPPALVLSLKAGGTGLNLTAASHVIHFDRWWNPAVEDQATDRAYRIGQCKNVLVHKFVCQGTVEENIDAMLEAKKGLSEEILRDSAEAFLTEMSNEELMRLVALDRNKAVPEG